MLIQSFNGLSCRKRYGFLGYIRDVLTAATPRKTSSKNKFMQHILINLLRDFQMSPDYPEEGKALQFAVAVHDVRDVNVLIV